jgi:hypothetical protein
MATQLKTVSGVIEEMDARRAGLAKLREPFPDDAVSKLPKETKAQIDARKKENGRSVMVFNCQECGGHHHKDVVHLDYVGHAALTDRLLKVDPEWSWEPLALGPDGLPALDRNGGLWIRLTVCGVTRLGYGDAEGKQGGNAIKEAIGDALRNAGMRFGAALDLWHKGDLHADEEEDRPAQKAAPKADPVPEGAFITEVQRDQLAVLAEAAEMDVRKICDGYGIDNLLQLHADSFEKCAAKLRKMAEAKQPAPAGDILDDEIPY